MKINPILLLFCYLCLYSCTSYPSNVERAFYYWKSNSYSLTDAESKQLQKLHINKLYVKFFEVEKNPVLGASPVSKSILHTWKMSYDDPELEDRMKSMEIVPVVFIRNDALHGLSSEELDTLASNIVFLIDKRFNSQIASQDIYREIQIDCDWTATTKDNYFYLLRSIRKASGKELSCTLRLYPYKYPGKMGVPPVDRATLMCYNLTAPLASEDENSIQNNLELERYLKKSKKYPLHLDVALPFFSWIYLYRNNQFQGVLCLDIQSIDSASLKPLKPLWYEVQKDLSIGDYYLRPGDVVKVEEVSEKETLKTISLLKKYVSFDEEITVTLFSLDATNSKSYSYETLTHFYDRFLD